MSKSFIDIVQDSRTTSLGIPVKTNNLFSESYCDYQVDVTGNVVGIPIYFFRPRPTLPTVYPYHIACDVNLVISIAARGTAFQH